MPKIATSSFEKRVPASPDDPLSLWLFDEHGIAMQGKLVQSENLEVLRRLRMETSGSRYFFVFVLVLEILKVRLKQPGRENPQG